MSRRNENLKIPFYYPQVWQNNIKKKKVFQWFMMQVNSITLFKGCF